MLITQHISEVKELGDNPNVLFEPHDDKKKVLIIINQKKYYISDRFSFQDSREFCAELEQEQDYNRAIAIIVTAKLKVEYGENSPVLQDVIDAADDAFNGYILAVVSSSEELHQIFDDTDSNYPIKQRFGMAYKLYIDGLGKRLANAMRPALETYDRLAKSIDFTWVNRMQEIANKMRPAWIDAIESITQATQMIVNALQPFQEVAASIAKAISEFRIPTIPQEEKEKWTESYKKWGEIGWPALPNAPVNFFNDFPEDEKEANKLAMQFCGSKSMNELFAKLYEQNIKKSDLDSAIFCYKNRQYKACALMLFGVIDSKMIRKQAIVPNSRRRVGARAVKALDEQFRGKSEEEQFLYIALYQLNLITCLSKVFADGEDFRKEPPVVNRNFIDHGMNTREVRRRDCIQLFLILHNLLEQLQCFSSCHS